MSIVRYKPTNTNLIDWALDSFLNEDFIGYSKSYYPSVDVTEEADKYVMEADLPGLTDKDIEITVKNSLLTVSSKKSEEKETKKDGYLIKERKSSSFCRSFTLPKDADADSIDAGFKNGVLKLTINKKPEEKPKSIEVKAN